MNKTTYKELCNEDQKLLDKAAEVMETAYNPYSNFYVGAAILSQNKEIITGSNVENASFGMTICAERAAILRTNAKGIRTLEKLAIIARGDNFETTKPTVLVEITVR